jgi:hypothetical protein
MNIYYLEKINHDGVFHGVTFTTEALAIAYGNEFQDLLPYKPIFGWCEKDTGLTVLRLRVASLRVD